MREFNYKTEYAKLLTPDIVNMLTVIHEFKGEQTLFLETESDLLTQLLEIAKIQSTEASNRIEGIITADERLKLIVTENGVAVSDDARRVEFIRRALEGVQNCLNDGIPVKGYCYWSLLDNFEWQKGFGMTFGLAAVDRSTQTRTPKESLKFLGSYAG